MSNNFKIQQSDNPVILTLLFSLLPLFLLAQESSGNQHQNTRILFLLDGSYSMNGTWENERKIDVARRILYEITDSVRNRKNVQIALRVYGHQNIDDCKDTKLEMGFEQGEKAVQKIKTKMEDIRPKGKTPIAYSLERAAGDFTLDPKSRNILIILSDGQETCGGDPCAVSLVLQKKGVFLRPFIIGMQLSDDMSNAFGCVGAFYNAKSVASFANIMRAVVNRAINLTTVQVSLMDKFNKPTETDVNMTFYDDFSRMIRYDYYHTLNNRFNPDTLFLDPINTYNLTIHTLPPLHKESFDITPDQHNEITFNAPQGYLKLVMQGIMINNNINNKIKCLVKDPEENTIVNIQQFNTTEKYLMGKYNLEILTLPRKLMKNVDIAQSNTTSIQIEVPGLVTFIKNFPGTGGIFMEEANHLVKIYELNAASTKETVALQPGTYKVIFRPKTTKRMAITTEQTFQVIGGASFSIKL